MKRADFRIVASTAYAGKVSMRAVGGGDGLREALTAAGFQDGEQVVLIEKRILSQLLAAQRGDATQALDQ
jgi:Fe2+ transport system protein FeoA